MMIPERVREYAKAHIDACDPWVHGGIGKTWTDGDGNTCIQYEDGCWWHYRETEDGLEWW